MDQKELDRLVASFEDRMKAKEEEETRQKEAEAEKLRQYYLSRTGRKTLKPQG